MRDVLAGVGRDLVQCDGVFQTRAQAAEGVVDGLRGELAGLDQLAARSPRGPIKEQNPCSIQTLAAPIEILLVEDSGTNARLSSGSAPRWEVAQQRAACRGGRGSDGHPSPRG